jgi:hypothetical protein
MGKPMTVYMVRHKIDKKFCNGRPNFKFAKTGRVWTYIGPLRTYLSKRPFWQRSTVEIVKFELHERGVVQ